MDTGSDALARDPVFGEVARALNASGNLKSGDSHRLVTARVKLDALTAEDRAVLADIGANLVRIPGHPWDFAADDVLCTDRAAFEEAALRCDALRCILSASENTRRPAVGSRIMGVVNVTPDSFSDGGRFLDANEAIEHGLQLEREGAEILDVGGESTRPGSDPVSVDEELRRTIPVVEGLSKRSKAEISIDTTKSAVALAALDAGASIVNDVSAGRFDDAMLPLVAERQATFIAMHMLGTPRDMQKDPRYGDVVADVLAFLRQRAFEALRAGVQRDKLWIDPGIGFGKTLEHNLELLRRLSELRSLGLPLVIGVSRKSFIGKIHPPAQDERERIGGTAAAVAISVLGGAEILRVHDVAIMAEAAAVARALAP